VGKTSISWTDRTWNCVRGCSRVSEGCRNCYAERQARRFAGKGGPYEGLVETKLRVINADEPDQENRLEPRWTGKVEFVSEHLCDPLSWKSPSMVFVNSMSDVFHEKLTDDEIAAIFGVMAVCPQHTFQVLTKRAKRMHQWFSWLARTARACNGGAGMTPAAYCFAQAQKHDTFFTLTGKRTALSKGETVDRALAAPWPLPNVWLMVSVENQDAAEDRIPELLTTPAAVRGISAEPLLGELNLWAFFNGELRNQALAKLRKVIDDNELGDRVPLPMPGLDWVIAGCESGPRARACDYRWLRSLRDQCKTAGVAFFLKQATCALEHEQPGGIPGAFGYGTRAPNFVVRGGDGSKKKTGGVFERPYLDDLQHLEFPKAP
jgi:protein gp37